MPDKINQHASHDQKLISLYALMLFSGDQYSLTELAGKFECSKQTVLRLIEAIEKSSRTEIERTKMGNRSYYRIVRPTRAPITPISEDDFLILEMCRDFTAQFLGKKLFTEATNTLLKSRANASAGVRREGHTPYFSSFCPGTIDYTPQSDIISTLIDAMKNKKVCHVSYQAVMAQKPKTHAIMPLKIFSHKDTMYLHARIHTGVGQKTRRTEFDPLLAVHRMKDVKMTDIPFEMPVDYKFDEVFNQNFGVIKQEDFRVKAEFSGWAARFVSERTWSPDQKITKKGKEKILLEFTASSETEVLSWILSFGDQAKLLAPPGLVPKITDALSRTAALYRIGK